MVKISQLIRLFQKCGYICGFFHIYAAVLANVPILLKTRIKGSTLNAAVNPPENLPIKSGLLWFRHDLRLHDHQALTSLSEQVDRLLCVYIFDPQWLRPSAWQAKRYGEHRLRFLAESLADLKQRLSERGQRLFLVSGSSHVVIPNLINEYAITHMASSWHPGVDEKSEWDFLAEQCQPIEFNQYSGHTLFDLEALPFALQELPASFTPFRKKVEGDVSLPPVLPEPALLPAAPQHAPESVDTLLIDEWLTAGRSAASKGFAGGETAGRAQLRYYLEGTQAVAKYKETRNGLDGWDYSSKLSAWLANGCLSARMVMQELQQFEQNHLKNDSTYWLFFELLWREYYQWYLTRHEARLFAFSGVQKKNPLTTFYPGRFAQWREGNTPYPIVNAAMHQLRETGYMSNRGRQLVASCLVHELGVDWRYGAAYFEEQLVDYDVASNWGNWQYLAGVGADPRGHRRFDLNKQTATYDPNGEFIARWDGNKTTPIDSVDASDWPLPG